MKSFLFATIASVLFLGSSAIVSGSPAEESEDYATEETGQFLNGDSDDLSVLAKKKKGKGKKGKKGSKKGKGKGKKSSTDEGSFDVSALLAIDADYNSPFQAAVNGNADDEDAQFTSDEDDESFVSAKKKKGKGKKGKGKGKGKKGKGKKSSTDDESFDVSALMAIDACYSSPLETVVAVDADDEDAQFTSDEDDDQSFVSAKKKKGKGKKGKGKGKGKGKKGKGKKSSTEDLFDVVAEAQSQVAMLTTLPIADNRTVMEQRSLAACLRGTGV